MKTVFSFWRVIALPLVALFACGVRTQALARYLLGSVLGALAITGFAAEECDATREVQAAVARKMSKAQQDKINDQVILLCSRRQIYASNMQTLQSDKTYIDEMNSLMARYCGSDPDSVGRGQRCRQDKAKLEEYIKSKYDEDVKIMLANEKRIKKQELRLEQTKNANPLPNGKTNAVLLAKQASSASIAQVKEDVLESLKDPGSAQFRRIAVSADGGIVCGEVNAKNAMGGYVGFKKFVNIEDKDQEFTYYEDGASAHAYLQGVCEGLAKK